MTIDAIYNALINAVSALRVAVARQVEAAELQDEAQGEVKVMDLLMDRVPDTEFDAIVRETSANVDAAVERVDALRDRWNAAQDRYARCGRCGGSGNYGPHHIISGKCFSCGGSGIDNTATRERCPVRDGAELADMFDAAARNGYLEVSDLSDAEMLAVFEAAN